MNCGKTIFPRSTIKFCTLLICILASMAIFTGYHLLSNNSIDLIDNISTVHYLSLINTIFPSKNNNYTELSSFKINYSSTEKIAWCRIPEISPWDESISHLIEHPRKIDCRQVQPYLTYLDDDGILHLNKTAFSEFENKNENQSIVCEYEYFDRGKISDREIIFEPARPFFESLRLEKKFVRILCRSLNEQEKIDVNSKKNRSIIYANLYSYYPIDDGDEIIKNRFLLSKNDDDVNVFLFFIESVSKSMFRRHLPLTYRYLIDRMNSVIFEQTLKVGENTLPNLAALFTGMRLRNEQLNMRTEFKKSIHTNQDGFFDNWPMIWRRFEFDADYETTYLEEDAKLSTFHYGNGRGFQNAPVHNWYFPFWEIMQTRMPWPEKPSRYCYGNIPAVQIYNQILRQHIVSKSWRHKKQFLFSIFNQLSHDSTNDLERADEYWLGFLEKLNSQNQNNYFNRTILIVAGDHGPRFADIRSTSIGFYEERTPFLSISLPEFLTKKYPHLSKNLRENSLKLTTFFDLHETLLDILNKNYSRNYTIKQQQQRGLSLFRSNIDFNNRTCFQAGIPDRYCLCGGFSSIDFNDRDQQNKLLISKASKIILTALRNATNAYRSQCRLLKIEKILYFLKVPEDDEFKEKEIVTYFLAFTTKNSNSASFEGSVRHNLTDQSISYKFGTLERINSFGGKNAACASTAYLKKFCICKKSRRK